MRCKECGLEVHRACESLAPACLGDVGSLAAADGLPTSDAPKTLCVDLVFLRGFKEEAVRKDSPTLFLRFYLQERPLGSRLHHIS